jgi:hypothetical protein
MMTIRVQMTFLTPGVLHQCSAISHTIMLRSSSLLQCSVIFHCYNAHTIPHSTVLNHSSFTIVLSHSLLLQRTRAAQSFCKMTEQRRRCAWWTSAWSGRHGGGRRLVARSWVHGKEARGWRCVVRRAWLGWLSQLGGSLGPGVVHVQA